MQFSPIPQAVPLQEQRPAAHTPPAPQLPLLAQPHCFCINAPTVQTKLPVQSLPQPPQLKPFPCTFSSQPSSLPADGVTQLAKPKSHVDVQVEPTQTREAVLAPEQVRPHAPQLKTSSTVTVSHPSSAVGAAGLIQSPNPPRHVGVQMPFVHAVLTEFAPEHT